MELCIQIQSVSNVWSIGKQLLSIRIALWSIIIDTGIQSIYHSCVVRETLLWVSNQSVMPALWEEHAVLSVSIGIQSINQSWQLCERNIATSIHIQSWIALWKEHCCEYGIQSINHDSFVRGTLLRVSTISLWLLCERNISNQYKSNQSIMSRRVQMYRHWKLPAL